MWSDRSDSADSDDGGGSGDDEATVTMVTVVHRLFYWRDLCEQSVKIGQSLDLSALSVQFPFCFFRDDVVTVLDMAREHDMKNVHHVVGATKIFESTVKKKGKIRWADRYIVFVQGRLLVFRNQTAAVPINAISLTEAIPKSGKDKREIIVSVH